jgi:hypothetical protein
MAIANDDATANAPRLVGQQRLVLVPMRIVILPERIRIRLSTHMVHRALARASLASCGVEGRSNARQLLRLSVPTQPRPVTRLKHGREEKLGRILKVILYGIFACGGWVDEAATRSRKREKLSRDWRRRRPRPAPKEWFAARAAGPPYCGAHCLEFSAPDDGYGPPDIEIAGRDRSDRSGNCREKLSTKRCLNPRRLSGAADGVVSYRFEGASGHG